jgi:putative ABC transport system permease protein
LVMVALAMLVALALAEAVVLPLMNGLLQWDLQLADVPLLQGLSALTGATLLLAVLAGAYPAFYLTSWSATKVLRGEVTRGRSGQWFRSTLVVVQFTISIALIVTALVMNAQLRFVQTSDKGYDVSNVMTLRLPLNVDTTPEYEVLLERLRSVPGVEHVALGGSLLGGVSTPVTTPEDPEGSLLELSMSTGSFLELFRIPLLAGRYPGSAGVDDSVLAPARSPVNSAPSGGVVLNAAAARLLGWTPEEALGRIVQIPSATQGLTVTTMTGTATATGVTAPGATVTTVIGVVRDTVGSARRGTTPTVYLSFRDANYGSVRSGVNVRFTDAGDASARAGVEQVWKELYPADSLQITFVEQTLEALYASDRTQMRIFGASATLAVLIACFGLFGLATFNTERRTKEIGVRKVMGSSVWQIVWLLTHDFSRLVLLSNIIAWPLAYVVMERWLENFAHRIDLTPLVFIGSGLIALCIAWVTVGGTAAKAATQNPVLALRYE